MCATSIPAILISESVTGPELPDTNPVGHVSECDSILALFGVLFPITSDYSLIFVILLFLPIRERNKYFLLSRVAPLVFRRCYCGLARLFLQYRQGNVNGYHFQGRTKVAGVKGLFRLVLQGRRLGSRLYVLFRVLFMLFPRVILRLGQVRRPIANGLGYHTVVVVCRLHGRAIVHRWVCTFSYSAFPMQVPTSLGLIVRGPDLRVFRGVMCVYQGHRLRPA